MDKTQGETDVGGDGTSGGWVRQAESGGIGVREDAARNRPAPRPRLSEYRIRDGEVVKEGFVRPLARRVSRLGPR